MISAISVKDRLKNQAASSGKSLYGQYMQDERMKCIIKKLELKANKG